jgi:hypothetical protein
MRKNSMDTLQLLYMKETPLFNSPPFNGDMWEEPLGEHPAIISQIPAALMLDDTPHPYRLEEKARAALHDNPSLLKQAKSRGQDVVARITPHGKELLIGAGVTAFLASIAYGTITIYKHKNRNKKR